MQPRSQIALQTNQKAKFERAKTTISKLALVVFACLITSAHPSGRGAISVLWT